MKKLLLICSLVGGLVFGANAQTIDRIDQVYLQGSNLLQGTVVDTLDGQLRLRIVGDSLLEIPLGLVQRVKEGRHGLLHTLKGRTVHAAGTYFSVNAGTLSAKNYVDWLEDLRWAMSVQFSAGYYVKPWLSVGAGLGIDTYEELVTPVFLEAKVYTPGAATAPYFSLQTGYGIAVTRLFNKDEFDRSRGGFMWYPSVGIRLASRRNADFHLDFGYKFQKVVHHFDYPDDWWTTEEIERLWYRSFAVRLGCVF